jgi:hypothetical protein
LLEDLPVEDIPHVGGFLSTPFFTLFRDEDPEQNVGDKPYAVTQEEQGENQSPRPGWKGCDFPQPAADTANPFIAPRSPKTLKPVSFIHDMTSPSIKKIRVGPPLTYFR